jgi:hypothetical protein
VGKEKILLGHSNHYGMGIGKLACEHIKNMLKGWAMERVQKRSTLDAEHSEDNIYYVSLQHPSFCTISTSTWQLPILNNSVHVQLSTVLSPIPHFVSGDP